MFRLDQERTKKIFEEKSPGLILFIGQDETGQISDDHKSKFKTLQEIAQELQDQIDITWTTLGSQIGKKIGPLFVSEGHENGILDKDLPAVFILKSGHNFFIDLDLRWSKIDPFEIWVHRRMDRWEPKTVGRQMEKTRTDTTSEIWGLALLS